MVQTRSQSKAANNLKKKKETLSGEIIKLLFDYADDASFIDKQEYTKDEIYDFSGGILLSVFDKTSDTILVKYLSYDHHNEPIQTSLISINKILNTEYDYSRTKYAY
jgi:hypothetical protein